MTLDQCYQKYQGTSILVPGGGAGNNGQCAQWADTVLHEVYGLDYIYTPAAKDWWNKADALGLTQHFDKITDGSVKKGDFVVYNPINAIDVQGHIDTAAQDGNRNSYVGYDSNWGGLAFYKNGYPILHTVTHADSYNKFILGSLRLKGGSMTDKNQIGAFTWAFFGRDARPTEVETYGALPLQETINRILTSPEYQAFYDYRNANLGKDTNPPADKVKPYDGPPLFVKE